MMYLYLFSLAASIYHYVPFISATDLLVLPITLYITDTITGIVHVILDNGSCGPLTIVLHDKKVKELKDVMIHYEHRYVQSSLFERMCFEFQKHHDNPSIIVQKSILQVISTTALFTWIIQVLLLIGFHNRFLSPLLFYAVTMITLFGTISQVSHQLAHTHSNCFIRLLQQTGLLLSPSFHKIHHTTYDCNFPIVNGWSSSFVSYLYKVCYSKK